MVTDDDLVFRALADPTRRHLLDRLFERDGRTLGELEADLEMTRFGVMKHLKVLEAAGLVAGQMAGLVAWTLLLWRVVPWRPRLDLPREGVVVASAGGRR